jgi:hypothetical protein
MQKPMKKTMSIFVISTILFTAGCASGSGQIEPYAAEEETEYADRRALDPRVLMSDALFRRGDIGVETERKNGLRLFANDGLRQVWPSPGLASDRTTAIYNVISTASSYFGTPYEFGSNRDEPSTFDCSDFTRWVYLYTLGMDLPKDSRAQAEYVRRFSSRAFTDASAARLGDLLFFSAYQGIQPENYWNTPDRTISHVGVYIGNGKMIHTASAKTGGVRIDPIKGNHFEYRFVVGGGVLD